MTNECPSRPSSSRAIVLRLHSVLVASAWLVAMTSSARAQAQLVTSTPIARAIATQAQRVAAHDAAGGAQDRDGVHEAGWPRVTRLTAGEEIRVDLDGAPGYRGKFRAADEAGMTMVIAGHDHQVARARIRQVSVARGSHRRRHTWLGLAIGGAASGVAVGWRCRDQDASCTEVAPAYVYPLAGAGALIGALLPTAPIWGEIYRRPAS